MVVAEVFEHIAVPAIGAALADDDHLAARGQTIFGAEIVRDNSVFLDAIHTASISGGRIRARGVLVVYACAFEGDVVRTRRRAVRAAPWPRTAGPPSCRAGRASHGG